MLDASFGKLMQAVHETTAGWLPLHESVLSRIEQRFEDGTYEASRVRLKQDLKLDVSLYTFCLRELVNLENRISHELEPIIDPHAHGHFAPSELFRTASLVELREIIHRARNEVTKYSFAAMTDFQAIQLHQSMLSAVTSETLATRTALDPEVGFTCGLLRQFGKVLIAWNYPDQYERALKDLRDKTTLDAALQKSLGFSPQALALTFARRWNLPEQIISALSDQVQKDTQGPFARASSNAIELRKICSIAEAFAQASYPDYFPNARARWNEAHAEILKHFGPQGMQSILQMAKQHFECYQGFEHKLPDTVSPQNIRNRITEVVFQDQLLRKNKSVDDLPQEVRDRITKTYKQLQPNAVLKNVIRELVKDTIPLAGFPSGCIFMYCPEKQLLSPALGIGATSYKQLPSVPVNSRVGQHNIIASAYSLKAPLRAPRTIASGASITTIAASLGGVNPIGVLYLETHSAFDMQPHPDVMTAFRALRQCLMDCLNLA